MEEDEEIPEAILNQYRDTRLYLPALTAGYVCDDRMDGHAREAIQKWQANYKNRQATTTLLQLQGETSGHLTGHAS